VSTGADLLVAALQACGVEVVFGLPGVHNLDAWNALDRSAIRLVVVRHEQTAVYAADGYARATGRLGVALVTTGPGAANTLGACGEAWASRSPVLVIATDIPLALRRPGVSGGALHECADQAGMFAPVTKARRRVEAPAEIPQAVHDLWQETLVPRPVYLEVPADVLAAEGEGVVGPLPLALGVEDEAALERAARLLAAARRPLVWAGGGAVASGAAAEVAALAEALGAPVFTTYSARGLLGDHPLSVGLPPHVPEAGALWDDADVVIAIGSDLDGMNTQNWRMPAPPRLASINADAADAAKNYVPDVIVEGDAGIACAEITARLAGGGGERPGGRGEGPAGGRGERPGTGRLPWADLDHVRAAAWARLRAEHPAEVAFLDAFAAAVPDDAVVLADMCIPGYWIAGFHRPPGPRRLQYPMGWGTLGYAFPAAVGAAVAATGPVVSISGDGGFLFACGELATVAQERLPVTAVIVDDGGYGMLRFDQARRGAATSYGIRLHTPDFVALARAFGLRSEAVDGLGDDFAAALAGHVADAEPSVLVARAALQPPPTTSPRWYRTGPPRFH
jgi:thiamine pyrophosphate-dependent acetolactate synthase large subunit-like protein